MRLIVVSGLSGSGKSVALHMLEDLDWYCVDNIPAALLKSFVSHTLRSADARYQRVAVGLDARNTPEEIATVPALLSELRGAGLPCELLFVTASDEALLRRYAETRRKHPLSRGGEGLRAAIELERQLLDPVVQAASIVIDTSNTGVHELREMVRARVERRTHQRLSLLFQSFGFKHGIPGDADYVFDARSLPNPYWEPTLRPLTGRDREVARYLAADASVTRLQQDITRFVEARVPEYLATNRRYLSVAVGCTGGQHRSVYLVEALAADFARRHDDVSIRHTRLPDDGSTTQPVRKATA
ncbi:MAG TPA: RNase adapter RapZ [Steroidobacteraceae bacterium]|nr:RNase adapter RapZ [Steroidobacteraceae bacterium]